LDNINRLIAENFIGLLRTDFRPATKSFTALTPNLESPSPLLIPSFVFNDETTLLHDQYRNVAQRSQE